MSEIKLYNTTFNSPQSSRTGAKTVHLKLASRSIKAKSKLLKRQHSSSRVSRYNKIGKRFVLPVPFRFRLSWCSSVPSNRNRLVQTGCQRKKAELSSAAVLTSQTHLCKQRQEVTFKNKGTHVFGPVEQQLRHHSCEFKWTF